MHPMRRKSTDLSQEHTMGKEQSSANGAGKMDNSTQIKKDRKIEPLTLYTKSNQIWFKI